MAKIIGSALPNIPWQEPPANTRTPFWRYDANPIIGRDLSLIHISEPTRP
mgnify:CR=1 FL=1